MKLLKASFLLILLGLPLMGSDCCGVDERKKVVDAENCAAGLVWSETKHRCYGAGVAQACGSAPLDVCAKIGCVLDEVGKSCHNPIVSFCSSVASKNSCNGIRGCSWNAGSGTCLSSVSFCSSATDEKACTGTCTWDPESNQCLSFLGFCTKVKDEQTCKNTHLCTWDPGSQYCLDPVTSLCSSVQDKTVCQASYFCSWSAFAKCVATVQCLYYQDCEIW